MKNTKKFFRYKLLELQAETELKPIVFSGTYKHTDHPRWVTVTAIREKSEGKSRVLCGHINLSRAEVEPQLILSKTENNRVIFFLGRISTYLHYGDHRATIEIAYDSSRKSVWLEKSD